MKLFLLVLPLLLRTTESACGGADKTSVRRFKMPNKSVFTRLAGIDLMEIFEITNQRNHEVCAQQCDAHAECAVFEFNLANKLCVLASEYARLSEDLAKGAFETIIFVKVRGKFTKAFPKEKETCLDKSEYEDYVKHEVDKWLNPSSKKPTTAHGSTSPTTVTKSDGSGGETTTGIGSSVASSTSTVSGSTSSKASSAVSTSESSTTSPTKTTVVAPTTEPEKTTTSAAAGTTPTTTKDPGTMSTSTTITSTPGAVPTVPVASSTSASNAPRSDSSVPTTPTTVSKKGEDAVKRSTSGTTQSTSIPDESTTVDDVKTTRETTTRMVESEEPSSTESSPGTEESSTTTAYVEEVSTTAESEEGDSKSTEEAGGQTEIPEKTKVPVGKWRISLMTGSYWLRAKDWRTAVEMSSTWDKWSQWYIEETKEDGDKIVFKSMHEPGLYLSAHFGSVNLARSANEWEHWTAVGNSDGSWSFKNYRGEWLTVGQGGAMMQNWERSDASNFMLSAW